MADDPTASPSPVVLFKSGRFLIPPDRVGFEEFLRQPTEQQKQKQNLPRQSPFRKKKPSSSSSSSSLAVIGFVAQVKGISLRPSFDDGPQIRLDFALLSRFSTTLNPGDFPLAEDENGYPGGIEFECQVYQQPSAGATETKPYLSERVPLHISTSDGLFLVKYSLTRAQARRVLPVLATGPL